MNLELIENQLINISFTFLLIILIIYWTNIIVTKITILQKIGYKLTIITNLLISISLIIRCITYSYFPLSNLYESLIFLTWSLTFLTLFFEKRNKSTLISAITIPISLFTISFASLTLTPEMKQASPLVPALRSNWLIMHVSIMILSYAVLIIGSLLSMLFLIISQGYNINIQGQSYMQTNKLFFTYTPINTKINQNQDIYENSNIKDTKYYKKLNLLESLDNLSYRIIGLGFPLLTIGIIAGAVWANEAWGSYWSWDPKETWALITWIIFAIYLHSRLNQSWQGKKPAILASIGFIIIWICYLGVNFLGKGLHSYGWLS